MVLSEKAERSEVSDIAGIQFEVETIPRKRTGEINYQITSAGA